MEEIGRVIEISDDVTKVVVKRSSACQGCKARACCHAISQNEMIAGADNPIGAQVGQTVKIALESRRVLIAAFIIYVIPLLFFLLGFVVGSSFARLLGYGRVAQSLGIIVAFVFLALAFILINRFYGERRKAAEKFRPVIKEII